MTSAFTTGNTRHYFINSMLHGTPEELDSRLEQGRGDRTGKEDPL